MEISLTPKQAEYIRNANRRWNFAVGAVRSGKSHVAVQYVIPKRIRERLGKKGLVMIFGASRENIERNVLSPMREIWGKQAVGEINNRSMVRLFGDKAYCIGVDNIRALNRIRGSEVKYAYCDEVCDSNEEVFDLVKSRLSLEYSCFDGCANPAGPRHFVKRFIDTPGLDLYCQTYTLYDNPFLPEKYVKDLEREYKGTVNFDRYILGLWKQAEGLVYPFDDEGEYTCSHEEAEGDGKGHWCISVDYGTVNPFAALLWRITPDVAYIVDEYYWDSREKGKQLTDEEHYANMDELANDRRVDEVVIDPSAGSFKQTVWRHGRYDAVNADNSVIDGIRLTNGMLRNGSIKVSDTCENFLEEMGMYRWDEKAAEDRPIKEFDHAMDAMRYMASTVLGHELRRYDV